MLVADAEERFKQPLASVFRDAFSLVLHGQFKRAVFTFRQRKTDLAINKGLAVGIVKKIEDDAFEELWVSAAYRRIKFGMCNQLPRLTPCPLGLALYQ